MAATGLARGRDRIRRTGQLARHSPDRAALGGSDQVVSMVL